MTTVERKESLKRRSSTLLRPLPTGAARRLARFRAPVSKLGRTALLDRDVLVDAGPAAGLRFNAGWNTADYVLGCYEVPVQETLLAYVAEGDVVLDVGANVGFFAMLAAREVGPTGCVIAFEPAEENCAKIRHNAVLNSFDHVEVVAKAVGARTGTEDFCFTSFSRGHALASTGISLTANRVASIEVVAIDDLVAAGTVARPDFVKIDVEGAELEVLTGMTTVLAEARPVVLVEVDHEDPVVCARNWDEIDALLSAQGYAIERLARSYDLGAWTVGHTLAVPRAASSTIDSNPSR